MAASLTPLKRSFEGISYSYPVQLQQQMQQNVVASSTAEPLKMGNVDEDEDWVTVYGFIPGDTNFVLREFEKCGGVLEHFTGSGGANWMHILYQNRSDAEKALGKSGMQIKENVIVGVKPLDPIQRQTLNEERIKEHERAIRTKIVVNTDRITRALKQSLHLLHRSNAEFFILGATGNVYTVTLSRIPSCNCPDHEVPCKHMLFVFLRVLGVAHNDDCLATRTLKPCQLTRLLSLPTSPQTLASAREREKFRHILSTKGNVGPPQKIQLKKGAKCPYCSDELKNAAHDVVECGECGAVGHELCLITYKVRRGMLPNCKSCWEPWEEVEDKDRYLNLTTYVSEDNEESEDSEDDEENEESEDSEDDEDNDDNVGSEDIDDSNEESDDNEGSEDNDDSNEESEDNGDSARG